MPWFYQEAIHALEKHPETAFFAADTLLIDQQFSNCSLASAFSMKEGVVYPQNINPSIVASKFPIWTSIVFRKSFVDIAKDLDISIAAFDVDFIFKLASKHPFIVSKKPGAIFSIHLHSLSSNLPLSFYWPGWKKMLSNIEESPLFTQNKKSQIYLLMTSTLKKNLFRRALVAFTKNDMEEFTEIENILKNILNAKKEARILNLTKHLCKLFYLGKIVKFLLLTAKSRNIKKRNQFVLKKYGWIMDFESMHIEPKEHIDTVKSARN